jgi:glyoxylase-like metal-dependent hydrolase (beta-lactamase superfamily II)
MDGLTPIVPGLDLLAAPGGGRFPHSHSFVIRGDVDALIDTGCGVDGLRSLRERWQPDLVVVSHSHPDHCAGLWLLQDLEILSPVQHSEIFWRLEPQSRRLAGPDHAAAWRSYVCDVLGARDAAATDHFEHGQLLDFGTITLQCIHTPGHLDDHYVLFEPKHGVALTFDIDLTSFGPWYGHDESDIDDFLQSIDRVIDLSPRMLVSSHKGVVIEDIPGRLGRYADIVRRRDDRILALLRRPSTVTEIVDESPIYGGHPFAPALLRYWEGNMITKHLVRLATDGRVIETSGWWRRA